jgi:hypothetical protein
MKAVANVNTASVMSATVIPQVSLPAPHRLRAEPKIAMRGSLHESLRSHEFNVGIEACDHCMISIAVDEVSDIREPKVLKKFGVSAACDVKVQMTVRLINDIDVEAATASPQIFGNHSQRCQAAAVRFGPFSAVIDGEPTDGSCHEFASAGLAKFVAACLNEGYEYARLDLAPL